MTRRKRTPSPSSSRKRAAFEIPASLQQLSVISRSLAKRTDTTTSTAEKTADSKIIVKAEDLGHSNPFPLATASVALTNRKGKDRSIVKFVPQTRSFPDAQPWPQPKARKPVPTPVVPLPDSTLAAQSWNPPVKNMLPRTLSQPTDGPATTQESPARPGETLCLSKHPHQIAALIAQKRAENEANRNRERWMREQVEHQAIRPPREKHPLAESRGRTTQSPQVSGPRSSPTTNTTKASTINRKTTLTSDTNSLSRDNAAADVDNLSEYRSLFSSATSSSILGHPTTNGRVDTSNATTPNHAIPSQPNLRPPSLAWEDNLVHKPTSRDKTPDPSTIPPLFTSQPRPKPPTPPSQQQQQPPPQPTSQSISVPTKRPKANSSFPRQPPPYPRSYPTPPLVPPLLSNHPHVIALNVDNSSTRPTSTPAMAAGYYKIHSHSWASPANDGMVMSPPPYAHNMPVVSSQFYAAPPPPGDGAAARIMFYGHVTGDGTPNTAAAGGSGRNGQGKGSQRLGSGRGPGSGPSGSVAGPPIGAAAYTIMTTTGPPTASGFRNSSQEGFMVPKR